MLWLVLAIATAGGTVALCVTQTAARSGTDWPPARLAAWLGLGASLVGWITLEGPEIGLSVWLGLVMVTGGAFVLLWPLRAAARRPPSP